MPVTETDGAPVGVALWGTEPVRAMVGHASTAERVGFESIWLVDTQMICRELYVTLAACAAATETLVLATGVTVPGTRHESVTAAALATLAEYADGRVVAGISTGHSAVRNIGGRPATIEQLADYVGRVRSLLDGRSVSYPRDREGALTWLDGPTRVPVHIAASGPRLTRAAAAMGDGVILLQGAAPDLIERALVVVEEGRAATGRGPDEIETTVWVYVGLDDDREQALDQVRARVAAILRLADPAGFEGEDREVVERLRRSYDMYAHAASMPEHASLVPERMLDRYAIAGTPDEVRVRIDALRADPRIDRVVVSPQVGSPALPVTGPFLERFGAEMLDAR